MGKPTTPTGLDSFLAGCRVGFREDLCRVKTHRCYAARAHMQNYVEEQLRHTLNSSMEHLQPGAEVGPAAACAGLWLASRG